MGFGLARYDAGAGTRRLTLPEISVDPKKPVTLIVRVAGERNKAWDNYQFKRRTEPGEKLSAEDTPERRSRDRMERAQMLAETVIAGWENVVEDDRPATFAPETALRFLTELSELCPDVWYRILVFVHSVENFRTAEVDPVDLGKG